MKKISSVLAIAIITVMMTAAPAFAAGFSIESTTPENGAKNTTKENLCVKITFNNEVGNKESAEANKDAFRIVNNNGKELPSLIYYNEDEPKYALVLADTTKIPTSGDNAIKDNTEYTCILDADFRDNDGNTLGQEQKISFTTMNQGRGMIVYMVLMVGMMVAMMGMTIYQTKKEADRQAAGEAVEESFNPYKEAKQSGKTVEQVIAEHEKEKNRKNGGIMGMLAGGKEDAAKDDGAKVRDKDAKRDGEYYCVKRPQPISAAGSTYKTGRKAKAEAAAAKAEAEKQARKAEGYSKKKSEKKDEGKNKKKKGGRK
ncbi:MAG: Ig-like domain-containing protein [Eubacterium sp.]|nr:Ig-like domain-containing protein [Eubacterium sp.]